MQKILYQRSEVKPFLSLLHLPPPPKGVLTCFEVRLCVPTGVPWVQVEVRQRTFPSLRLSVAFLATWRLEAAALIETHPSPSTSSSGSLSLSLFQNSLFHQRERKGRTEGEREGWRSEEKEDEGRTCTGLGLGREGRWQQGREDRS